MLTCLSVKRPPLTRAYIENMTVSVIGPWRVGLAPVQKKKRKREHRSAPGEIICKGKQSFSKGRQKLLQGTAKVILNVSFGP